MLHSWDVPLGEGCSHLASYNIVFYGQKSALAEISGCTQKIEGSLKRNLPAKLTDTKIVKRIQHALSVKE